MNASHRRKSKGNTEPYPLMIACGRALLFGIGAAAIFLLLAAALAYSMDDPIRAAPTSSLAALYLALTVTGVIAARSSDTPLTAAAITGGLALSLVLLLSLIAGTGGGCGFSAVGNLFAYAGIPLVCTGGALIGKKRVRRGSSRHKKHRR